MENTILKNTVANKKLILIKEHLQLKLYNYDYCTLLPFNALTV